WTEIAPIRQLQIIQYDLENMVTRLVVERPLKKSEEEKLITMLQERFDYPFHISFEYIDKIERSRSGKFEDFISEVSN
ncbi:MAG: phenylacetate--CoA ligase family protein, partial [Gammaproteobacteria bacterium]|nr:phenylacetate--CoA ligase family protein [Gammaproteobacteria bacterium]